MKCLIQRTTHASVSVEVEIIARIGRGIVVFAAIDREDSAQTLTRMADKLLAYRIFSDGQGKMNLNVKDVEGGVLVVSQFTLSADTRKGLRPSFSSAAPPEVAEEMYHKFVNLLKARYPQVKTGRFGADMKVSLQNDGPVTFLLEM